MSQIFQMRYCTALQLKGLQNYGGQSWSFERETVLLDPGTLVFESTLILKMIFFRSALLTSRSLAALCATRLHSTSFERSDSYLLGNSSNICMKALLRYFICAKRCDIYHILRGHRANQTALAFFRILERSWPLTSIFCFESVEICCVYLF